MIAFALKATATLRMYVTKTTVVKNTIVTPAKGASSRYATITGIPIMNIRSITERREKNQYKFFAIFHEILFIGRLAIFAMDMKGKTESPV